MQKASKIGFVYVFAGFFLLAFLGLPGMGQALTFVNDSGYPIVCHIDRIDVKVPLAQGQTVESVGEDYGDMRCVYAQKLIRCPTDGDGDGDCDIHWKHSAIHIESWRFTDGTTITFQQGPTGCAAPGYWLLDYSGSNPDWGKSDCMADDAPNVIGAAANATLSQILSLLLDLL